MPKKEYGWASGALPISLPWRDADTRARPSWLVTETFAARCSPTMGQALSRCDPSAKAGRRRHPSRRTVEPLSRRFPWLVARFETWTTPARVCPQ